MKTITIYTKDMCPYCDRAKAKLKMMNIPYQERNITKDPEMRDWLKSQGHRTVPQLYLDDTLFVQGGCDGLMAMNEKEIFAKLGK